MTDEETAARATRAFGEMQEVQGAFDRVEAALMYKLAHTPIGQDILVLKLHMAVQNLDAVKTAIREVIDAGRIAEHALSVATLTRPF